MHSPSPESKSRSLRCGVNAGLMADSEPVHLHGNTVQNCRLVLIRQGGGAREGSASTA